MAVDLLPWLRTFQNQRKLARHLCMAAQCGLVGLSFITFVFAGIMAVRMHDNTQSGLPVLPWSSFIVGALAMSGTRYLNRAYQKVEDDDLNVTDEQRRVKAIGLTALSCSGNVMFAGAEFAIASIAARQRFSIYLGLSIVAAIAGCLAFITAVYDAIKIYRGDDNDLEEGAYAIHLDEDE